MIADLNLRSTKHVDFGMASVAVPSEADDGTTYRDVDRLTVSSADVTPAPVRRSLVRLMVIRVI